MSGVRILVTALTSATLLRRQAGSFRQFIKRPYELVVINDARVQPHFSNLWCSGTPMAIKHAANVVGARHIRFPQYLHEKRWRLFGEGVEDVHDANSRCADAIQYGVNVLLRESDEPLLIIDADMIPITDFDWRAWLGQHPIWGVPNDRGPGTDYLWNGIVLVDPRKANAMDKFNLNCGQIDGIPVDVGGKLHDFLLANEGRVGHISRICDVEWLDGFELCGGIFAHMRGGGNWQVYEVEEAVERMDRFIAATESLDGSS